jgi:ferredoxin
VALRTDRRELSGRPPEGIFLEFPKERILACIGADLPVSFLGTIGIHRLKNADDEEELMAVSPTFESEVRNVYLIGDLLSPAFIQTTDFRREAVQTTVLDHTGNFKQGMIDGVLVVEGISQKKSGRKEEEVVQHLDKKRAEFEALHKERLSREESKAADRVEAAAAVERKEPTAKPQPPALVGARFAWVVQGDGARVEKEERTFATGRVVIGKTRGELTFPEDEAVQDDHVAIDIYPDACYVTNENMKGAAYVDVKGERTIQVGDSVLAGDQNLRVETTQFGPVLAVLDPARPDAKPLNLIPVREGANVFGRGNLTPDQKDMKLSRRHFSVQVQGNVLTLRDFGSRNGTYIPVGGTIRLNLGDELCFGSDRRLRFKGMDKGEAPAAAAAAVAAPQAPAAEAAPAPRAAAKPSAVAAAAAAPAKAAPPKAEPAPAKPAEAKKAAVAGAPGVTITNKEIATTVAISEELSLLEKLIELGMATDKRAKLQGKCQTLWSCKSGNCGLCLIKVVGNPDGLSKPAGKEKRTLKTMVDALNQDQDRNLDPNACRLACLAKVAGPVEVELLGDTDASD